MPSHSHRSGGLKQTNKRNKRSKASKRSLSRSAGGKVSGSSSKTSIKSRISQNKANRRHAAQQRRQASRQALIDKRRGLNNVKEPRVVGIVSLGPSAHAKSVEEAVRQHLLQGADNVLQENNSSVTAKYNVYKKNGLLTFLTNSTAFHNGHDSVAAALDLCRICDICLFIVDAASSPSLEGMEIGGDSSTEKHDGLISPVGDEILSACKAQGLPTPVTVLAHGVASEEGDAMTLVSTKSSRRGAYKRQMDLKRYVSRFAITEFGNHDKVVQMQIDLHSTLPEANNESKKCAALQVVRTLCEMACSPPKWVAHAPRSYLVAEKHEFNSDAKELSLTGFVRGPCPYNVNSPVHVPNVGTFACKHVKRSSHALMKQPHRNSMQIDEELLVSNPENRESLERFATPDALEGEQNLIGFDEAAEDMYNEDDEETEEPVARPAGWSNYQSAWLDALDVNDEDAMDHGELAKALNQKKESATSINLDMEDADISETERLALLKQRRNHDLKENMDFPDEIELDQDVQAQDRLARYRSLKSFRKSFWDPKENLPESFATIYHLSNFKATQRDVLADQELVIKEAQDTNHSFWGKGRKEVDAMQQETDGQEEEDLLEGCIPTGTFVTITLENVPTLDPSLEQSLLTAVTLLPHENKVSVLQMNLSQPSSCETPEIPIKSKDVVTFRCGWRTWKGRPVYSQDNLNSDKHKFERFMPLGGAFFAANVFGPITYTPCPVLMFSHTPDDGNASKLLAMGSIVGASADRIVIKRVVLTGYPVRVHKRHATVKYMFYNPDDVAWFKPAGLFTKHGLHGHIVESVGEHGTMKCLFNAPIQQHDTVCLPLYKRMYPKYALEDQDEAGDNRTTRTYRPALKIW